MIKSIPLWGKSMWKLATNFGQLVKLATKFWQLVKISHQLLTARTISHQLLTARTISHQLLTARKISQQLLTARTISHQLLTARKISHQILTGECLYNLPRICFLHKFTQSLLCLIVGHRFTSWVTCAVWPPALFSRYWFIQPLKRVFSAVRGAKEFTYKSL